MNWVGEYLKSFASEKQNDIAINFSGGVTRWGALYDFVEYVAKYLSLQTPEGGKIGISLPNSSLLLILVLGAARSGRIAVVYDTEWPKSVRDEIFSQIKHNILISSRAEDNPSILISHPNTFSYDLFSFSKFKKTVNLELPNPSLPFYIGFTSGTSGLAKGFVRSQKSWVESFKSLSLDIKINNEKGVIALGSFSHSIHLYAVLEALYFGSQISFLKKFKPSSALEIIETNSTSLIYATPSQLLLLVRFFRGGPSKKYLSVKTIITGGSKWNQADSESLKGLFPSARLIEFYGTSEMSFVSVFVPDELPPKSSVGRAITGVSIRICDHQERIVSKGEVGKIWVKSKLLFNSYAYGNNKEFQRENDWVTIGDFGRLDKSNFLYLAGREDRMFVVSGKNVYPEKIEELIINQDGVVQAAVFGIDDKLRGKIIIAVIHAENGAKVNIYKLKVLCRNKLMKHEIPKFFKIISFWPLLSSGKPDLKGLEDFVKNHCEKK